MYKTLPLDKKHKTLDNKNIRLQTWQIQRMKDVMLTEIFFTEWSTTTVL
jgi:hypothetical protein